MKSELVILIGNIGTGKSTISKKYSEKGYYVVCRDSLRTMIGGGKYIFNNDTEAVIDTVSKILLDELLNLKVNVVLDETNMAIRTRRYAIGMGKEHGYKVIAHVTRKLSKEDCIAYRMKDNLRGTPIFIWESVWEKFNSMYQQPSSDEGFDNILYEVNI